MFLRHAALRAPRAYQTLRAPAHSDIRDISPRRYWRERGGERELRLRDAILVGGRCEDIVQARRRHAHGNASRFNTPAAPSHLRASGQSDHRTRHKRLRFASRALVLIVVASWSAPVTRSCHALKRYDACGALPRTMVGSL